MKNCKICNKKFKDTTSNQNKVYCTKVCARKNQTIRTSKLREVNIKRKCKGCGKSFIQKFARKKFYCNLTCYEKTYTEWKKEFYKNKYHTDPEFRKKYLERRKEYNKKNPEVVKRQWLIRKHKLETDKKYKAERRKYEKEYEEKNKEKIKERQKKWRKKNIETVRKKARDYQIRNKDKILIYQREWNNRPETILRRRKKDKERRKTDSLYRLRKNIRGRFKYFVRNGKAKKLAKTRELLGCDWKFLINHLEKQFKPGMNWKNYGKWHIDHILPMTSFNLHKKSEQMKCCNYKNLQPLWAKENLSKGNRIIPPPTHSF